MYIHNLLRTVHNLHVQYIVDGVNSGSLGHQYQNGSQSHHLEHPVTLPDLLPRETSVMRQVHTQPTVIFYQRLTSIAWDVIIIMTMSQYIL